MHLLNRMYVAFLSLKSRDEGATMVEYGIMVALIAVVAFLAVQTLGNNVNDTFGDINTNLGP
jgi:pilus assembly protein Flp/PilA